MTERAWSVAVVIPAFNRERFIAAAVESALAQTLPADEIIVVDDGSTDRTAEIVTRYAPPVRLLRLENNGAGPSRPRNAGIAAARSNYITLLDSDDRLAPTVLQRHRELFRARPDVGLVCNNYQTACQSAARLCRIERNQATVVHSLDRQEIGPASYLIRSSVAYTRYCVDNFVKTPGATLPKAVWADVGGFAETLRTSNDYDFFIRVMAKYDIVYVDEPLGTIVFHDANISSVNLRRGFTPQHALDHLCVLRRELQQAAGFEQRQALRGSVQQWLLDLAYAYRDTGSYAASAATYLEYLARGGKLWTGLTNLGKVPVCRLLDLLGKPRRARSSQPNPALPAVERVPA